MLGVEIGAVPQGFGAESEALAPVLVTLEQQRRHLRRVALVNAEAVMPRPLGEAVPQMLPYRQHPRRPVDTVQVVEGGDGRSHSRVAKKRSHMALS